MWQRPGRRRTEQILLISAERTTPELYHNDHVVKDTWWPCNDWKNGKGRREGKGREEKTQCFILASDEHNKSRSLLLQMSKAETGESALGNICLLGAKQTQKSLCRDRKWITTIKYYPCFFLTTWSLWGSSTQTKAIRAEAQWDVFPGRCSSSVGGQAGQIHSVWHDISDLPMSEESQLRGRKSCLTRMRK